jgi:hypothetical protein
MTEDGTEDTGTEEPTDMSTREAAEAAWDENTAEPEDAEYEEISEDEEGEASEEEPIEYPSSWSATVRERIGEAPREFQEWAIDWSKNANASREKQMQELAGVRQTYEPVANVIAPYMEDIKASGETPEERVQYALELDRDLDRNPVQTLLELCEDYGIHPSQLLGGGTNGHYGHQGAQPFQSQFTSQLQSIHDRLDQKEQYDQEQLRKSQEQQVTQTIEGWANEKDGDGELLRPFYKDVEEQMVPYILGFKQSDETMDHRTILQKSYEIAISQNEEIQGILKERADKAKEAAVKAKAAKAAKAGSSIKGSPSKTPTPEKPEYKTTREAAEAAWEEVMGT